MTDFDSLRNSSSSIVWLTNSTLSLRNTTPTLWSLMTDTESKVPARPLMWCAVTLGSPETANLPLTVAVIFSFLAVCRTSVLWVDEMSDVVFGTRAFVVPESMLHQRFEFVVVALEATANQSIDSEKSLCESLLEVFFSTISWKPFLATHGLNLLRQCDELFDHVLVLLLQIICCFVNSLPVFKLR